MKKLILLLSLSISITFGQQVTGYYPTWKRKKYGRENIIQRVF
jgi:hypothetical protein